MEATSLISRCVEAMTVGGCLSPTSMGGFPILIPVQRLREKAKGFNCSLIFGLMKESRQSAKFWHVELDLEQREFRQLDLPLVTLESYRQDHQGVKNLYLSHF